MAFDRTLISIRERSQIDLFDLALVVIRRRPWPLISAAVCGMAPFVALNAWVFAISGKSAPTISLVLWWLEFPIASAPLTLVLGTLMFGQKVSARSITNHLGRSFVTLGLTHGLLRFIPSYWIMPRLFFANEIILLEKARWVMIGKRGANLAGRREADLVIFTGLQFAATLVGAILVDLGLSRLIQSVAAERMTWELPDSTYLTSLAFQSSIWVGVAFFTVVRFLTYIDQRIRLEGWEVKLRLRAAGMALAEARRW